MAMKKIFYEKVGRRYKPVYEYDQTIMDAFPKGTHIVMCYPGGQTRRYNIDPNYAAMIAAGRIAEDAICRRIQQETELRPANREIDAETQRKWKKFIATVPEDFRFMFTHGSARDAAEAGVKAMQEEADKLMQHESVRRAFDNFVLMCQLVKERDELS
jgi:hypothetical protein